MWEDPTSLWRRLKLGREEFLQRLVTTLILDGKPPPWNTPRPPGAAGQRFLQLLDEAAHGTEGLVRDPVPPDAFVDEYLLPKLEDDAANGWPDWAALWPDRVWVIELKTEAGSHRPAQLPYYLRLAAAAHPGSTLDLTYITGALNKPAPTLLEGQRYSHLTWDQVVLLINTAWGHDPRPEVVAYVEMVRTIVTKLEEISPAEQRQLVLGRQGEEAGQHIPEPGGTLAEEPSAAPPATSGAAEPASLLELARATVTDGRQRAVGAQSPDHLEALRDRALADIAGLPPDDAVRHVLPWLWDGARAGGRALTPEGEEFGYELRFSRYKTRKV